MITESHLQLSKVMTKMQLVRCSMQRKNDTELELVITNTPKVTCLVEALKMVQTVK